MEKMEFLAQTLNVAFYLEEDVTVAVFQRDPLRSPLKGYGAEELLQEAIDANEITKLSPSFIETYLELKGE